MAHSLHFWEPQFLPTLNSSCGVSVRECRCKGPGLGRAHEDTPKSELLCFLSLGDQRGQAWQANRLPSQRAVLDSPSTVFVSQEWALLGGGGQVTLSHPLKAALFPVPHVCLPVIGLHLLEFKEDPNLEPWEWGAPPCQEDPAWSLRGDPSAELWGASLSLTGRSVSKTRLRSGFQLDSH